MLMMCIMNMAFVLEKSFFQAGPPEPLPSGDSPVHRESFPVQCPSLVAVAAAASGGGGRLPSHSSIPISPILHAFAPFLFLSSLDLRHARGCHGVVSTATSCCLMPACPALRLFFVLVLACGQSARMEASSPADPCTSRRRPTTGALASSLAGRADPCAEWLDAPISALGNWVECFYRLRPSPRYAGLQI
uniref:Uncharacterized protein n=1 Tax=Arundo donax TaxID=35708 RepID=A0A0A9F7G8_ARUDO